MQLTPNFTLAELTASATAQRHGIDNTPPPELVPRLVRTAEMLERIRSTLGVPIIVTSGYRGRQLNALVGGVTSSDHTQGNAADIIAPRYGTPYEIARALVPLVSVLQVGQLIYEHIGSKQWVHVSTRMPDRPSNRVITMTRDGAQLGIQEIES